MIHALVTPKAYFAEVLTGERTADIKKDDRPYKKGDVIILQEYDADKKLYTGREVNLTITSIARNTPREGLRRGFVFICFNADKMVENELPEGYGAQAATVVEDEGGAQAATVVEDEGGEDMNNGTEVLAGPSGTLEEAPAIENLADVPDWLKGKDTDFPGENLIPTHAKAAKAKRS
jgi:hypothetical protein